MTPELWRQIDELYHAARERGPGVLADADPALRREVESLLAQQTATFVRAETVDRPPSTPPPHDATQLTAGSQLGPYRIESSIGRGGMGEVWKAHDPRLGRNVAIKVSARQFDWRSEREARAIAALNHPNICQIYDVGPNYLVMEFIEGTPPRGPLAPDEAVKLALGIAAGLEAAHGKGIIHRDLKPANILTTPSGVKLLDFGLALMSVPDASEAETMAATIPGTVMGTAGYMSPEQATGKPADARSDIFSFGLVLYELLSGQRAFNGGSAMELMAAIVRDEPPAFDAPAKLSEIVLRCLRKNPDARFQTMSEIRAALEQAGSRLENQPARGAETPSIAVLPFANLSGDKEQEYFSDGLAEEILNLLSKIPALKVIARTSSFAFRGKEQDIRGIAQTLGVRNVLEGSVRRAGNRIRVTAQLIEAENGSQLWSERYDRDLTDVFAVQDEIGQAISQALKVQLAPKTRVVNVEAWQHLLKGIHHRAKNTPDAAAKAKEHFEQALAIDPNYAQAWSGLALCYYVLALMGVLPYGEATDRIHQIAEKALAIDASDSEAHLVLAMTAGVLNYDWERAARHHRLSVTCENVSPRAHYVYGQSYLAPHKRAVEAIEQVGMAIQADPLSVLFHTGLVWCLIAAGRYEEAIACARRALEIDPNYHLIWAVLGAAQLSSGRASDAVVSFSRLMEVAPWHQLGAGGLAAAHWLAGDRECAEEMAGQFGGPRGLNFGHAVYYATAGEADAMFNALDSAYRQRDFHIPFLPFLTFFDPWRTDPRFRSQLARIHLG